MRAILAATVVAAGLFIWALQPPPPFQFGDVVSRVNHLADSQGPRDRALDLVVLDDSHASGILDFPVEASLASRLRAGLRRRLVGPPAPDPASQIFKLRQAAARRPNTVVVASPGGAWNDDALQEAVAVALAAGLRQKMKINVLAQGRTVAPALKAIKKLEPIKEGEPPLVKKFIALGMNRTELQRLDPDFFREFGPPKNLVDWINAWNNPYSREAKVPIEVLGPGREGITYQGEYAIPGALGLAGGGTREITVGEFIKFLDALIAALEQADEVLEKWAQEAANREAGVDPKKAPQTKKSHDGYYHSSAAPAKAANGEPEALAAEPQEGAPAGDSLSMIRGGEILGAGGEDAGRAPGRVDPNACPKLTPTRITGYDLGDKNRNVVPCGGAFIVCSGAEREFIDETCRNLGQGWYGAGETRCSQNRESETKPAYGPNGFEEVHCGTSLPVWCCVKKKR